MNKSFRWLIFFFILLNWNVHFIQFNVIVAIDDLHLVSPNILMDSSISNSNFDIFSTWHYSDHNFYCQAITFDSDGNFYLTGTDSHNWGDICVLKLSSNGNYLWHTIWGGYTDCATGIAVDSLGNVYVSGYSDLGSPGSKNALIMKYSSSGYLEWMRWWNGPESDGAMSVAIDSQDNIYVVGYTSKDTVGGNDVLLLKYNIDGDLEWNRTWGGIESDLGYDIAIGEDGLIYITGYVLIDHGSGFEPDILLLKYNSSGNLLDQYYWGEDYLEIGTTLTIDSQSNIYIAGYEYYEGEYNREVFLYKIDNAFNLLWNKSWGGDYHERAYDIALNSKGTIYVIGDTQSFGSGSRDFFLLTYNQVNETMMSNFWGNTGDDRGTSLLITPNNDLFLVGQFLNNSTNVIEMIMLKARKPNITIISPTRNQEFGAEPPLLNISINDVTPITAKWYTIDEGTNFHNFSKLTTLINNEAWNNANYGNITINVYAMDELSHIGQMSVMIVKSYPETTIFGYNFYYLTAVIIIASILIIRIKLAKETNSVRKK